LQTATGIKLKMNDQDKSVLIEDPSGNTWHMDGKGNISVNAPKDFTLNAGENVKITAGKDVSVSAGNNINHSANDNITQTAGNDINQSATGDIREFSDNRTEIVEKDFKRQAYKSDEIANEITFFSTEKDMTMQSGKEIKFNSAEKSKMF
jgi:type VI secretion system secreted protein VgrG